jgi:hypothetical protein
MLLSYLFWAETIFANNIRNDSREREIILFIRVNVDRIYW